MSDDTHAVSTVSSVQKTIAVLGGIAAPVIVVYMMVTGNAVTVAPAVIDVASNIKPVAEVEVAPDRANYVDMSGEEVVNKACAACHASGMMNAPKLGDEAGWKARIALGYEKLTYNAINGVRMMPARGGNPDLTDLEVSRAVAHMANEAGATFVAPEAETAQ